MLPALALVKGSWHAQKSSWQMAGSIRHLGACGVESCPCMLNEQRVNFGKHIAEDG